MGEDQPDTVRCLMAYLKAAGHGEGPLFRAAGSGGRLSERLSGETVARIFKGMAKAAGIEATAISGHSTRIGKAQDCVAAGIGIGQSSGILPLDGDQGAHEET